MFSGIVEKLGRVLSIEKEGSNVHFEIGLPETKDLYIDQSIAHNGVCLTITSVGTSSYKVTAIEETMNVSNLGKLKVGSKVNLERAMLPNTRLDGHMVQGHVDSMATLLEVKQVDGSWYFIFSYDSSHSQLLVSKGSIAVNGVSLTVVNPSDNEFTVAIIPYTYENTNFCLLRVGDTVNLEFDIIGKYVAKQMAAYRK